LKVTGLDRNHVEPGSGFTLVSRSPQHRHVGHGRQTSFGQRGFSHAGLALDGDQRGLTSCRPGEDVAEAGQFRLPPDEDVLRPTSQRRKGHTAV
jgi:hypothetical protein